MSTEQDKNLIRTFYQGLATQKEKDLFYEMLRMSRKDRVKYLTGSVFTKYGMNAETYRAILYASSMTREDLVKVVAQEVRKAADNLIIRFFKWLGGLFS